MMTCSKSLRKVILMVDDEMPDLVKKSDSEDEDEDAREEYERNQAMVDTDRDMSSLLFYF